MHWITLLFAVLFEVLGTTSMKLSEGFTKVGPSVAIFIFYAIAFVLLTITLKKLDVTIAYAIWAGLGTLIISVIGVFFFHEAMTWVKAYSIFFIIVGVVGLNMAGGAH